MEKQTNNNLDTKSPNTWCPGCGNFGILTAFKQAVDEIIKNGFDKEKIVVVGDIGCNSKIADYLNLNSIVGLHGRSIATAEGVKLANSGLKVFVFIGDGAGLDEGVSHLVHAAKRNSNIKVILHNNRLFALTTGQFTAVSPKGLKSVSTPFGSIEEPINPLKLMLSSDAGFIARGYSAKLEQLKNLILAADKHKGFAFIEVLQPCVSFFNNIEFYNERVYEAENKNRTEAEALELINQWDYADAEKIPLGIIFQKQRPVFEEDILKLIVK
ncbi:MAG: thiamine pyrophosphate-dependent enzyme [Candidatus Paceibacterota bacterium]